MKKRVFVLLAAISVVLSGCSTTQVISSNPRNVLVESNMMDAKEAQRLADAECSKYKRHAKMTLKADFHDRNYAFECVD